MLKTALIKIVLYIDIICSILLSKLFAMNVIIVNIIVIEYYALSDFDNKYHARSYFYFVLK